MYSEQVSVFFNDIDDEQFNKFCNKWNLPNNNKPELEVVVEVLNQVGDIETEIQQWLVDGEEIPRQAVIEFFNLTFDEQLSMVDIVSIVHKKACDEFVDDWREGPQQSDSSPNDKLFRQLSTDDEELDSFTNNFSY